MDSVVIAMGGSVVTNSGPEYLPALADAIDALSQERQVFVVVGGGKPAREAIAIARPEGGAEEMLDRIGIQATRLNAQVLIAFLAARGVPVNEKVPHETRKAATLEHRVVVMGGTNPGHSTDHVGAELAQVAGAARLVIATNVDGVYTADPRKDPDAERVERLDFDQLVGICGTEWTEAGQAGVIDGPATALLRHSRIETRVVDGSDIPNLVRAAQGDAFLGTLVTEEP